MYKTTKQLLTQALLLFILFSIGCSAPTEKKLNIIPITTTSDAARDKYLKAIGLENKESIDLAEQAFQEAIQLDSTFALACLKLAMLKDDFDTRKRLIAQAMRHKDKVSKGEQLWILARNDFYGTRGGRTELELFKDLVELHPDDPYANYLYGFVNHHHGNKEVEKAIQYLEKATELKPDFAKAQNELAYTYLEKGDFAKAREAAARYVALLPDLINPYDTYAEILMREGDYTASIDAYQKILDKEQHSPWAIMGIAANLNFLNRHSEARLFLKKLDQIPTLSDYEYRHKWRSKVVSYLDEGQLDSALVVLQAQKETGIQNATTHEPFFHAYYSFLRRTRLFFEKKDGSSGWKEYKAWNAYIQENSKSEGTKQRLTQLGDYYQAYAHLLQQKPEKAIEFLNNYKKTLKEENDQYRHLLARIFEAQGQVKEALAIAKQLDLSDAYYQYFYAKLLQKAGEKDEAKTWFTKIAKTNERNDIDLAVVRKMAVEEANLD